MDIFKSLLTRKTRNTLTDSNKDSNIEIKKTVSLVDECNFESSYLEFTSFETSYNGQKYKAKIFFYNNVGRNKKYLITDNIRTELKEGIELAVIAKNIEKRTDFRLICKLDIENNQISLFLKTIF